MKFPGKRIILYISSPCKLSQYRGRIKVTRILDDKTTESKTFNVHQIEAIVISSKNVSITGGFLDIVLSSNVPVFFIKGKEYVTLISSKSINKKLQKLQLVRSLEGKFKYKFSQEIVIKRISALEQIINEYFNPDFFFYEEKNLAYIADTLSQLRSVEASATKKYFSFFKEFCKEHNLSFESRKRNPPTDVVNALISYGNMVLYTKIYRLIIYKGLDPYYGFFHRHSPMALSFDISDPYKPFIVDKAIIKLIKLGFVNDSEFKDFELSKELKKRLVQEVYSNYEKYEEKIIKTIQQLIYALKDFPKSQFHVEF